MGEWRNYALPHDSGILTDSSRKHNGIESAQSSQIASDVMADAVRENTQRELSTRITVRGCLGHIAHIPLAGKPEQSTLPIDQPVEVVDAHVGDLIQVQQNGGIDVS
jgi:hypothetical protein